MNWTCVDVDGPCPFRAGEFYLMAVRVSRTVWDINVAFMVEFSPSVYIDQDYEWKEYWQEVNYWKPLGELPNDRTQEADTDHSAADRFRDDDVERGGSGELDLEGTRQDRGDTVLREDEPRAPEQG